MPATDRLDDIRASGLHHRNATMKPERKKIKFIITRRNS